MTTESHDGAPHTPVPVRNWYDTRANIAALIRHINATESYVGLPRVALLVEKPWTYDDEWDAYQATLPEAQRWRGTR